MQSNNPGRDDSLLTGWPKLAEYPQTETGFNRYQAAWAARRRRAATLAQIPMSAVEEHRAALALAEMQGWEDTEGE